MAFQIRTIPSGTSFLLRILMKEDGFGLPLANLTGYVFAFSAVANLTNPAETPVLTADSSEGGDISVSGRYISIALSPAAVEALEQDRTYHWTLNAKDSEGRIHTVESGLIARILSPSVIFPSIGAVGAAIQTVGGEDIETIAGEKITPISQ